MNFPVMIAAPLCGEDRHVIAFLRAAARLSGLHIVVVADRFADLKAAVKPELPTATALQALEAIARTPPPPEDRPAPAPPWESVVRLSFCWLPRLRAPSARSQQAGLFAWDYG